MLSFYWHRACLILAVYMQIVYLPLHLCCCGCFTSSIWICTIIWLSLGLQKFIHSLSYICTLQTWHPPHICRYRVGISCWVHLVGSTWIHISEGSKISQVSYLFFFFCWTREILLVYAIEWCGDKSILIEMTNSWAHLFFVSSFQCYFIVIFQIEGWVVWSACLLEDPLIKLWSYSRQWMARKYDSEIFIVVKMRNLRWMNRCTKRNREQQLCFLLSRSLLRLFWIKCSENL